MRAGTAIAVLLFAGALAVPQAWALKINEYYRDNPETRVTYLSGVISGIAFQLWADGKKEKSNCVFEWYKTRGDNSMMKAVALEMERAEKKEGNLHVEGIILGLIELSCGNDGRGVGR